MHITFLTGTDIPKTLKKLIEHFDECRIAVAWGTDNRVLEPLLKNKKKVRQIVVGTHFYQTSPDFLEQIRSVKGARVMRSSGHATFHPKTYLFLSADKAALMVGSANFTKGGMDRNVEAALLIEGPRTEGSIEQAFDFIRKQWDDGIEIDDDFLRDYTVQYKAAAAAKARLEKFVPMVKPKQGNARKDPLMLDWDAFAALVRNDPVHNLKKRLEVLGEARQMIRSVKSFSELSDAQRKGFAGTLAPLEERYKNVHWAWFGSMYSNGYFKSAILHNAPGISAALDHIPHTGPVTEDDYKAYIKEFKRVFATATRQPGIAPASRLLAMKRPDYFVCCDSQNRDGLSDHFGFAKTTLDFDTYWRSLVEPLQYSPWWYAERPAGLDGEIWDGRAALLDAVYYSPKKRVR